MNRRQKIIVSVTGIFLVLLLLVGLTYAYFLTKINGNENTKSISVTTANLALVYGDGNGIISAEKIEPGTTLDKKEFTVSNEGNDTTDYVVVIEDVKVKNVSNGSTTTFESNDFVYTLTCTEGCNGVDTETTFPITGGILVGNSIEVGKTHTYELIVTYKETGLDQSNDMNKSLEAKVNIADPNGFNPYVGDKGSLAYTIINNAIALSNDEKDAGYAELRTTPLTTPAVESTMVFVDGGAGTEFIKNYASTKTFTETDAAKYYITYGDTYTFTTRYTITNKDGSSLQAVLLSTGYETLKGKYIVSYSGSTSSTPVSGSGKYSIYYVANATPTTIEYILLSSGFATNEKYITYGDSYKFDSSSGKYTLNNVKVVKYKEGYKTLVGKYVVNISGANSATAATATNLSSIYLVTGNSTDTKITYKTVTKKTTEDSYGSAESTLSMTPDDYGTSYYYRGGVKNNYLEFNNMCWRIVRIEGDGSIKITLAAPKACNAITDIDTGTAFIGNGDYGYTTNSNNQYFADYENSANRTTSMKYKFEEWFSTNLASVSNKLKKTTVCIGDTTNAYTSAGVLMTETEKQNAITNNSRFYYNSYVRLYGVGQTPNATLMCGASGVKTSETQIFPLTADEVVFAGGKIDYDNISYYLRDNASSDFWLTLSPSDFCNNADCVFGIYENGGVYISTTGVTNPYPNMRPAVSLIYGTQFNSGDGTISNPYTIK